MHLNHFSRRKNSPRTQQTRRGFLRGSFAFAVTSGIFPIFKQSAAPGYADTVAPDASAGEIAELGKRFRELEPETAARLDKQARKTLGLMPSDSVDWVMADKARLRLTERSRIAAELSREEVVFVDGWLLTNSEAGTALLYAAAAAKPDTRIQRQAVK